jgi:hypothetical protein
MGRHSRKKLKRIALERDKEHRAAFVESMVLYTPEQLGFLDEVSKDERTPSQHYARLKKGTRAVKKQPFVRGCHTSTEALLTLDGMVASTVVEGSMMKAMFLKYLELNVMSHILASCGLMLIIVLASQMLSISRPTQCPCNG